MVGFANVGGFGGGPIIIPLLMVFFSYDYKKAICSAYILIFSGGIGY